MKLASKVSICQAACTMPNPILEVCCGSVDFALAASLAGADRIELCDNLVEGGTTPSTGALEIVASKTGIPVMAMVRPRGGDFLYSELEFEVMLRDSEALAEAGAAGLVFGILDSDGRIDYRRTSRLIEAARPLSVTFHRAFDLSRDLEESLEVLLEVGADRVLTSVGKERVLDGLDLLSALMERAGDSIVVMPAGGIRPHNIGQVLAVPGVTEVHIGAAQTRASGMNYRREGVPMGAAYEPDEYVVQVADVDRIALTKSIMAESSDV